MKRLTIGRYLALFAVAALALVAMGASYGTSVNMDAGTQVSVHLVDSISSTSASPGDTVKLVAAGPALVQGVVAVISGAEGQGHVVSIKPPTNKKPASIAIQTDWITAVDGQHVPIAATKKGDPLIFGSGGPYESNYSKGKPVEIGPDTIFTAYVTQQRYILTPP